MAQHIIADEALGIVNQNSDIPAILADHGSIDQEMRERWVAIIGFRHILVYTDIDHAIVYDVLQHRLADFETLKKVFAQFL